MDFLGIREFVIDSIKFIVFVAIVILLAIYVFGFQQIVGDSMNPALKNRDVVLIDKLYRQFGKIHRGDIISFYYSDSKILVKRVIGLPGESVEYKSNKLYINGEEVKESYLGKTYTEDYIIENIPEDMYFVLGDNRLDSLDSRDEKVGLVQKEDLIGKVFFRIWPFKKIGFPK